MMDRVRAVALGNSPADILLKNGRVVDVLTETIYEADVAIADGVIAGVGSYDQAEEIIDLKGAYVAPGLINAHCHVESSMAVPEHYCAEELRWGVTTLITDPHEIANVAGAAGIHYMMEAGGQMPLNYYVNLPSCVPATRFEHSGCVMDARDMIKLVNEPGVLGMGEMMNVPAILRGVIDEGIDVSSLAFCTDDKHLADIRHEGTIRHCVQMAIELGMDPVRALRLATINAARIYGLRRVGAVAPGWQADLVVFDNLQSLKPQADFHKGVDALKACEKITPVTPNASLQGSVKPAAFDADTFALSHFADDREYPVITMLPGEIFTEKSTIMGKDIASALEKGDVYLIAVLERHHGTGNVGLGLLRGYGLKDGAVATTVAHDSHNLIVIGTSSEAMNAAAKELVRVQGGYTLVKGTEVVDTLPLNICGLMSSAPAEELIGSLDEIAAKAHAQGVSDGIDPFISLSFMALPVIPKLRITDMGMFDTEKFEFIK